jgi:hypothetical protein
MNLVLIETSGNQAYIFATTKLRENVGASELTARVCTEFVKDAIQTQRGRPPGDWLDPAKYPPIGDGGNPIEVILAVSGKTLLLVRDASLGRAIVQHVTLRALKEAPGLEVFGAVSEDFDFGHGSLHQVIGKIHQRFERIRSRLPGASARFQRIPVVAECVSSGLPAARMPTQGDGLPADRQKPYAAQTYAKLSAGPMWRDRLNQLLTRNDRDGIQLPDGVDGLEGLGADWVAIVHADGNGLGQVFLDFERVARTADNRDYVNKLRAFSLALNECTEKAFCHALGVLTPRRGQVPVVPLVLGGDDLTVVCDGRQALAFTEAFVNAFKRETRGHGSVNSILPEGVTSSAGIAIVKPHFPFFAGYQLADDLLKSAKLLKPAAAIDYHILYDSSGPDLERIRRELTIDTGDNPALLVARPYWVSDNSSHPHRTLAALKERLKAVQARDDDGRYRLPNSMLHELRGALFLGRAVAESRLDLVRDRYRGQGIENLLIDGKLFADGGASPSFTGMLDAIDTAEFWEINP